MLQRARKDGTGSAAGAKKGSVANLPEKLVVRKKQAAKQLEATVSASSLFGDEDDLDAFL